MHDAARRKRLMSGWGIAVLAFLYAPIAVVIVYAFNANHDVSNWTGFSAKWFTEAFDTPRYVNALELSLKIAALNAVCATVLGTAAALALGRTRSRWRVPFSALIFLTLVVPEIVIAVASRIFFVQAHDNFGAFPELSWRTILLAHVVWSSAIVVLIVRARFTSMGSQLEEASFDLGAPPVRTFLQVTLPRLAPAIMAGFLLTFTMSFDDYVLSVFTASGESETWPMAVFNDVRFGVSPAVNAISTLMFVIVAAGVAGAVWFMQRRGENVSEALAGGR
ncbi:MAG TPA: ABC transporter permease [Solirubrobacteraceae bacterium]|nr:ABC transporter permease [Solirubrobacteraceae bacterium]